MRPRFHPIMRRTLPLLFIGSLLLLSCSNPEKEAARERSEQIRQQIWVAVGSIQGVTDKAINGVVIARHSASGGYISTVQVNIDPAPKGAVHGVWLEGGSPTRIVHMGLL